MSSAPGAGAGAGAVSPRHLAIVAATEGRCGPPASSFAWGDEPPRRRADGSFEFADCPFAREFRPNRSPEEVLRAGSFGGTYFRPIKSAVAPGVKFGDEVWRELPAAWIAGLDVRTQIASPTYRAAVNKYKVKSGASLEEWETSGWMRAQDPYGWFQWFCRFFRGRRSDDDERQIKRWLACAGETGRWRNRLCSTVFRKAGSWDDPNITPVIRQTLLHWGYELPHEHYVLWGQRQGMVREPKSKAGAKSKRRAEDESEEENEEDGEEDGAEAASAKRGSAGGSAKRARGA